MDPLVIGIISALTALVASIAGPFVTLFVARRQFSATVLSANRQKWIETLRDLVAELISLIVAANVLKESSNAPWDQGRAVLSNPEMMPRLQRIVQVNWKIRLLINPNEADHRELLGAIEAALARLQSEEKDLVASRRDVDTIATLSQGILKREWQRVKVGR